MATKLAVEKGGVQFATPDALTKQAVQDMQDRAKQLDAFNPTAQKLLKPPARFHDQQFSPEDANFCITNFEYPRQRKVSTSWSVELGTLIEEGKLEATPVHMAHCKADGRMYLVDGYHRLAGLAMGVKPFTFLVVHHYCNTMDEVDTIYGRLDQGRPRRMSAAVRATGLDTKLGLSESFIERCAAAAQAIKRGFRTPTFSEARRSATLRMDLAEEWQNEARLVNAALSGGITGIRSKLENVAFLSVCLAIARYQPKKATRFIEEMVNNTGERDSGSKAFVDALYNRGRTWGRNVAEQSRLLASAWNAYYADRPVKHVAAPQDPGKPMDLLGTPWAGAKLYKSGPTIGKTIIPYVQRIRKVEPANLEAKQAVEIPEDAEEEVDS